MAPVNVSTGRGGGSNSAGGAGQGGGGATSAPGGATGIGGSGDCVLCGAPNGQQLGSCSSPYVGKYCSQKSGVTCVAYHDTCPPDVGVGGGGAGGGGLPTCQVGAVCTDCQCPGGTTCMGGAQSCVALCSADVKAGAPCDAAAPDCLMNTSGSTAQCVGGAWWVGVIAGGMATAPVCDPTGTWKVAYDPMAQSSCLPPVPLVVEIHAGLLSQFEKEWLVSFGQGTTTAEISSDGCKLSFSTSESFTGMESGSETLRVDASLPGAVGTWKTTGTGLCSGNQMTGTVVLTKE